jgi:biotin operon repressor
MSNVRFTKPSKKVIQVYEMLKDGKPFSFDKMVSTLSCSPTTVMVFICILRRDFGAKIETERDGRKVTAYRLDNAAALAKTMVAAPKAAKPSKAKSVSVVKSVRTVKTATPKVVVDDGSVPTLDIEEVNDNELASLKAELGLSESYSE